MLTLGMLEPDIAKARDEAEEEQSSCRNDNFKEKTLHALEPEQATDKKKLEAAAGVGGPPSNETKTKTDDPNGKRRAYDRQHPAPTHRTGH